MWPRWVKTRSDPKPTSSQPSSPSLHLIPHSPSFTLKNLQSLLDNTPSTPSASPPSPLSSPSLRIFHRVRLATAALRAFHRSLPPPRSPDHIRVVFYFTSLRIVRSTFIDCRSARSILRSLRIAFEERDVSLDLQFLNELKSLLRHSDGGKISLPQLFIGGRHIGGAEEIRRLHETGELKRLVDSAPAGLPAVCGSCGGERFVLCDRCNGSRKRYSEKGGGFRVCNDCNENGLRRCPDCCSVSA